MIHRVLILGDEGQLGRCLVDSKPAHVDLHCADLADPDLTDREDVTRLIGELAPDWVINATSYQDVDQAEEEEELAYRINCDGVRYIAESCRESGSVLIQISTDQVFDGEKEAPYTPDDEPAPLNVFGRSKREGEKLAEQILPGRSVIIRASWLYSEHNDNFAMKMLRHLDEREALHVVAEQFGSPTYAHGFAAAIWRMIENDVRAATLYHWGDLGVTDRLHFAEALQEHACELGLLQFARPIKEIPWSEYPSLAQRPRNSALDPARLELALGIRAKPWQENLRHMLERVKRSSP